jgi:hypothetical protein
MSAADIRAGPARTRITKNSGPCRAATNLSRVQLPGPEQRLLCYYIFLIAMYRRASGSDLTAASASAVPAAAMAIAVTYPSVRITFSCSSAGPRQRPATLMSLIPEQAARRTGGRSGRRGLTARPQQAFLPGCRPRQRPPMRMPACALPCARGPPCHGDNVRRRRHAPAFGPARAH